MIKQLIYSMALLTAITASAEDMRPVVGVSSFTCQENSPYTGLVTEKVTEMLTNTRRFRVVDRTSNDKITAELELQKSEAFLDSKNLVEQDIAVAAEKMITGHIVKIPVYRMLNGDNSVRGYKASVGFEMKLVDVATGLSSEATSFLGKASKECLSPEAAVTMAMFSIQDELYQWFRVNFPVTASVSRIIDNKTVLISAGSEHGVQTGHKFIVESIEDIDGAPYHRELGEIKVSKVAGPSFSECSASNKIISAINNASTSGSKIVCKHKNDK